MLKDLVVRVLNQTVGEYFENIDTSQLQLSVFGGDVALHDLNLKPDICTRLGLPFRLSAGRCGTLTLKIPWTSLYSQPVEIGLQDLYLLVVPGSSIPYDEDYEAKIGIKAKLQLANGIESAQRELAIQPTDPDSEDGQGHQSFSEKLAMQIVRNLQVRIESIHIRYEDEQGSPGKKFGVGAVLTQLSILTTNSNWEPKYVAENLPTIHKLLSLQGLALYWDSDTFHISRDLETEENRIAKLRSLLDVENAFDYVVGPISTVTKLRLVPNPEKGHSPFSVPKVNSETIVEELTLAMSNLQFQDILQLAESWDLLYRRQKYRKFRPQAKFERDNAKIWWKFSYNCILQDIRRKRDNWSWVHIQKHRADAKSYYNALYKKRVNKKVGLDLDDEISVLEANLDLFNILLIRKQVDLFRERKEREEAEQEKNRGWFSGWFGGSSLPADSDDLIPQEMSSEERDALRTAIGYNAKENLTPVNYPAEFVSLNINFRLDKLRFLVSQDERSQGGRKVEGGRMAILDLQILRFVTDVQTRPVNNGLNLSVKLGTIEAFGGDQKSSNYMPHLIAARKVEGVEYFIDLTFEQSPLGTNLDQRLILKGQPLEITYDSCTIQNLLDCFTPPMEVSLQKLQVKAMSKYIEWKAHSTAGILRMVETRGKIEIDVNLVAPYIIIPQNGQLSLASNVLVIELGDLVVKSKPPEGTLPLDLPGPGSILVPAKPSVIPGGKDPPSISSSVLQLSYDTFLIELRDFQVSLAATGEVIRSSRTALKTHSSSKEAIRRNSIYLVKSDVVVVRVEQSIVTDDARFPRFKVTSSLPLVDFDIPEERLMQLVNLIVTLPLPKPSSEMSPPSSQTDLSEDETLTESIAVTQITYMDVHGKKADMAAEDKEAVQFTDAVVDIKIDAIRIRVSSKSEGMSDVDRLLSLELTSLAASLTAKTFGTSVDVTLGGISLNALTEDSRGTLSLIQTPKLPEIESLLHIHIFTVTPDCPKFHSRTVKQHIDLQVASLDVTLHREVMVSLMEFVNGLIDHLAVISTSIDSPAPALVDSTSQSANPTSGQKKRSQRSALEVHNRAMAKKYGSDPTEVLLKVEAKLNTFTVQLATKHKKIMKLIVGDLTGSVIQRSTKSEVFLQLAEFSIVNLDENSLYRQIFSVEEKKVMFVQVTKYEEAETKGKELDVSFCDMRIKVETGSPKIHVVGSFLQEIITFANQFQTATKAVKEASAAAADAASKNVSKAYGNDARIALDIQFKAPRIILPENDQSLTVLMLDFGNLNFSNKFSLVSGTQPGTKPAIVDQMEIKIEHVQISRAIMEKSTKQPICEVLLLEPVTFTGAVQRNLSAEWFKELPAISLQGNLHSTFLRLSSEDYAVVMSCILDKLSALEEVSSQPDRLEKKELVASRFALEPMSSDEIMNSGLSFSMNLSLNNLGAVLYETSSHMEGKRGLVQRDERNSLAEFLIHSIVTSVSVANNGQFKCALTVNDIDLKDSRPGSDARKSKNLIQRRSQQAGGIPGPMVQFQADKNQKNETSVKLTTTSLIFLLCLDHVIEIIAFLNPPEREHQRGPQVHATPSGIKSSSVLSTSKRNLTVAKREREKLNDVKSASTLSFHSRKQSSSGLSGNFKGEFNLQAMEFIFVEDMDTIHTNAVLLNFELSMSVDSIGENTDTVGMIQNVKLNTCNFNTESLSQGLAEVVSPTVIMIIGKKTLVSGLDLEVSMSDIFVRLSAGTVELLTKISNSLQIPDSSKSGGSGMLNYSNIWEVKDVESRGLWYLKPGAITEDNCTSRHRPAAAEVGQDDEFGAEMPETDNSKEKLFFKSGSIVLAFEAGSEVITAPLLLIEASAEMQVVNWSSELELGGKVQLAAAYFNAEVGMWEYLLEPVPIGRYRTSGWKPLELRFGVNKGVTDEFSHMLTESARSSTSLICFNNPEGVTQSSELVCTLQCNDVMEFTLTRTAINVLTMLGDTFSAARKTLISKTKISTSPYVVSNHTGFEILVDLTGTDFVVLDDNQTAVSMFRLLSGFETELSVAQDLTKYSILKEQHAEDRWIKIGMQDFNFQTRVPVGKASIRSYTLSSSLKMTCDVWVKDCSRMVTFRGPVQIINGLNTDIDLLTKEGIFICVMHPKDRFSVPLTVKDGFFFAPARFKSSKEPFFYSNYVTPSSQLLNPPNIAKKFLSCLDYTGDEKFYIRVLQKSKPVLEGNSRRVALNYLNHEINLEPTLVINNMLNVPIAYVSNKGTELTVAERGKMLQVTNIAPNAPAFDLPLRVKGYESLSWDCRISIGKNTERLSAWTFSCSTNSQRLTLGIHKDSSNPEQLILHLYSPFWMVNLTGFELVYKGEKDNKENERRHPVDRSIVLFSFSAEEFFNKVNMAMMKPEGADWSATFHTETVGLSSFLTCKSARKNFEFGLTIKLCHGGLTKMIVFTPKYYLMNQCPYEIGVKEATGTDEQICLKPNLCIPFWPKRADPGLTVCAWGTQEISKSFLYDTGHSTLLRLNNKYGGIQVDVSVTATRVTISFSGYSHGKAPNLFLNGTTDLTLGYHQQGSSDLMVLKPGESQLVSWPDPAGPRVMLLSALSADGKPEPKEFEDTLMNDSMLEFEWNNGRYFWISFVEDIQRISVLVDNEYLVNYLNKSVDVELPSMEIIFLITGIGISLVDNSQCKELIYLKLSGAGVKWEEEVSRGKFRPLSYSDQLEKAYQTNLSSLSGDFTGSGIFQLDNGIAVDVKNMMLLQPKRQRLSRCPKQPGFWAHFKIFPHSNEFHVKLNRLQVDNQLPDATFVYILSPTVPPKTVAANEDSGKPFLELVFMQSHKAHRLEHIHFSVLVQEFMLKFDMGIINALTEMFSQMGTAKFNKMMEDFRNDYSSAVISAEDYQKKVVVSVGSKRFYNYLHLSPLKVKVSFSMSGLPQDSSNRFLLLLQGFGIDKLADFQDVQFLLACFELRSKLLTDDRLGSMVLSHYTTQGLKQFYVLILGLDFLGNPYALLTGITEGIGSFFYEPYKGLIIGPQAFGEGLSLGVKSLVGHTVGGAAEALSKVTGTLGKGFAAMTLDSEFQRKRNENLRQGAGQGSSITTGAKGFFKTGVFEALTGVVTNPIKGFQEGGLQGFGKGLLKGAVGMVARPMVGAADLARGTMDSVKRVLQEGDGLDPMRPPRLVQPSSAIQPYNIHYARGNQIFQELCRREKPYLATEIYLAHIRNETHVLLLTDRRVFHLKLTDEYGGSSVVWEHEFADFFNPPFGLVERGIEFRLAPRNPKSELGKLVFLIYDPEACVWMLEKLNILKPLEEQEAELDDS